MSSTGRIRQRFVESGSCREPSRAPFLLVILRGVPFPVQGRFCVCFQIAHGSTLRRSLVGEDRIQECTPGGLSISIRFGPAPGSLNDEGRNGHGEDFPRN